MKERIVLYAEEGYVLTNGEIYGKVLFLSNSEKPSDFYEIPEEEYAKKLEEDALVNAPE